MKNRCRHMSGIKKQYLKTKLETNSLHTDLVFVRSFLHVSEISAFCVISLITAARYNGTNITVAVVAFRASAKGPLVFHKNAFQIANRLTCRAKNLVLINRDLYRTNFFHIFQMRCSKICILYFVQIYTKKTKRVKTERVFYQFF